MLAFSYLNIVRPFTVAFLAEVTEVPRQEASDFPIAIGCHVFFVRTYIMCGVVMVANEVAAVRWPLAMARNASTTKKGNAKRSFGGTEGGK